MIMALEFGIYISRRYVDLKILDINISLSTFLFFLNGPSVDIMNTRCLGSMLHQLHITA